MANERIQYACQLSKARLPVEGVVSVWRRTRPPLCAHKHVVCAQNDRRSKATPISNAARG